MVKKLTFFSFDLLVTLTLMSKVQEFSNHQQYDDVISVFLVAQVNHLDYVYSLHI